MRCISSLVCALVCLAFGCDSVTYQGRTLTSWTIDLEHAQDFKRRDALVALTAMAGDSEAGDTVRKAVPRVAELLDDANPGVQEYARDALVAFGAAGRDMLEGMMDRAKPNL
ncbi:MAG: hypothetical protein AAFQ82_17855, partial [Myxococcota bacterium]